ncbi:helix-turn-helix transcriptional regulator [Mesonia mobilis]|uniref:helix-turn-helix transcriptional regulator n=1 Tax=Mesonia mobilis TaxID=369791 RepID=UPI0026EA7191|nr:WYL domain-containing protein [Mesonia mobilis]
MKTPEIVIRQHLIINKLRRIPLSFSELSDYLQLESEIQSLDFSISKRTFQREIKNILTIYNIEVIYDSFSEKYMIVEDFSKPEQKLLLEKIDLYSAFNAKISLSDKIDFEQNNSKGTQFLKEILQAIENKNPLKFSYQKFYESEIESRRLEPYLLKEYKSRWYVIGMDSQKESLRTFSLDRVKELQVLDGKFQLPEIEAKAHFENVLGIIGPNNSKAEKITITVTQFQAKYLKSLPWHHSQQLVSENETEASFTFYLVPTYDFEVQLLSLGSSLISIEPEDVKKKVLSHLKTMMGNLM